MSTPSAGPLSWLADRIVAVTPTAHRPARRDLMPLTARDDTANEELGVGHPGFRPHRKATLEGLFRVLQIRNGPWRRSLDERALPAVALLGSGGFGLVRARDLDGRWQVETPAGLELWTELPAGAESASLAQVDSQRSAPAHVVIGAALKEGRGLFAQAGIASLLASLLAFGASLYSMQVYDRVIPTQGTSTLIVLTVGVILAMGLELLLKLARSSLLDSAIRDVDGSIALTVFKRLLGVRLDQLPPTVGTLASQVRSYETIRSFCFAMILYLIDLPFAVLFLGLIYLIGGGMMVGVVGLFLMLACLVAVVSLRQVARHARASYSAANRKLGLLVEAVEGAETLKAAGGGWSMQMKWGQLASSSIDDDLHIRRHTETATYLAASLQQFSYVALIAVGAYLATTHGALSSGGILACSILSGRVLSPIGALPGLVVQGSHARVALQQLERVFSLRADNDACAQPLTPEAVQGRFLLDHVRFTYPGHTRGIALEHLTIAAGEKVGILGDIGAGKSTLLKLMAGLYAPQDGHVLLDGLDLQQVARSHLSEHLGYLPQDTRLLAGTLRENLLLGLAGRTDEMLYAASEMTGLVQVIQSHAQGLDLPIAEGGAGVSRGQKQLIALTRLLLSAPSVWLLDEPTASMDPRYEERCVAALRASIRPEQTAVIVTHRTSLLPLVDRVIVLGPNGILLDGPRDAILAQLVGAAAQRSGPPTGFQAAPGTVAPAGGATPAAVRRPGAPRPFTGIRL